MFFLRFASSREVSKKRGVFNATAACLSDSGTPILELLDRRLRKKVAGVKTESLTPTTSRFGLWGREYGSCGFGPFARSLVHLSTLRSLEIRALTCLAALFQFSMTKWLAGFGSSTVPNIVLL